MDTVNLSDLISITSFLSEVGINRNEFAIFRRSGRVDGLISIAGRFVVDRGKINIRFLKGNGERFKLWLSLGGRSHPVDVRGEMRRIKGLGSLPGSLGSSSGVVSVASLLASSGGSPVDPLPR